jgi:hypothetical protein
MRKFPAFGNGLPKTMPSVAMETAVISANAAYAEEYFTPANRTPCCARKNVISGSSCKGGGRHESSSDTVNVEHAAKTF